MGEAIVGVIGTLLGTILGWVLGRLDFGKLSVSFKDTTHEFLDSGEGLYFAQQKKVLTKSKRRSSVFAQSITMIGQK